MNNVTTLPNARGSTARVQPGKIWKIYLAGTMRMVGPRGEDALPRPRKTRALLAYLCLAQARRVPRGRLVTLLWDGRSDRGRRSLRQALYMLERINGAKTAGLVKSDHEYVALNMDVCWVDVLAEPNYHVDRLLDDLDGVSTDFDHWLSTERSHFEDRVRDLLQAEVASLTEENGPPDRRAAAARKLVGFDPTNADGVYALMKALADLRDHAQALREYQRYQSTLRAELDVSPSREITALYEAIRLASPRSSVRIIQPPKAELITLNGNGAAERAREPSIAVMPFRNFSGNPKHDYTADGLAEDLIEVLSRVPGFFVISRLSTRTFRGQDRLPQDIGDALDVRYLLTGSIRLTGNQIYLNAELSDAVKGVVLNAFRLVERFSNLVEVQMNLAEGIVREVAPSLHAAELRRVRSKRPEQFNAYDYFLQAQEDMHNFSPAVFKRAERMFEGALQRDPKYARALAWRAHYHLLRIAQGWSSDPGNDRKLAADFANRALDCDPLEPMAFAVQGHITSYLDKDFSLAFDRFEAALRLNPNAAHAWLWSAVTSVWVGDGNRAVEKVTKATALSPYDPLMYFSSAAAGMAYLANAQYERAIECAHRALQENGNYVAAHRLLVIALMLADRPAEARSAAHRLINLEPGVTVERFRSRYPGSASPQAALFCDALADAGIPRA